MKGNGLLLRVALRPLRLCVKTGLTSVAAWPRCVNCHFQVHTPRRFGRRACARWPAAMSFLAEASWLWWSLGVALVEPWGGFGGALGWLWWSLGGALVEPWCGFVLRSLCLVYAYNMALGWLWVASVASGSKTLSQEGGFRLIMRIAVWPARGTTWAASTRQKRPGGFASRRIHRGPGLPACLGRS